jgi:hypothetical protein
MLKSLTALFAALIAGFVLVGSATDASAGYGYHRHKGCCGGPIPPTYIYKTHKVYKNVTRYSNVYRTKYVPRIHRIVYVNRIQPIIHVYKVKRVHTNIVGVVRNVKQYVTQRLPAKTYVTSRVSYSTHCACSYRHRY